VLHALMSKDPAERPSAPDAIRMLESVAAGHTTSLSSPQTSSPLYSPTAGVPLADRSGLSEHTHAPTAKSEPIRPTFVEAEYRPTTQNPRPAPQQGGPQHTGTQHGQQTQAQPPHGGSHSSQGPAAAHGRKRRRVWPTLLAAGLVAALVGGGAAYELNKQHGNGTAGGTNTSAPPATSVPSSGPSSSPPAERAPLPAGYTEVHDQAGFSFPLPPASGGSTWVNFARKGLTAIKYSPDEGVHQVIFGVTPGQGISPLQHAQQMEASLTDKTYQQVSMEADIFQKRYTGARWEYTFTDAATGVPHHAMEQLYKDDSGTEYDILVDYPEADWSTGYARFQAITEGFVGG
jgi:hypothetical protein